MIHNSKRRIEISSRVVVAILLSLGLALLLGAFGKLLKLDERAVAAIVVMTIILVSHLWYTADR